MSNRVEEILKRFKDAKKINQKSLNDQDICKRFVVRRKNEVPKKNSMTSIKGNRVAFIPIINVPKPTFTENNILEDENDILQHAVTDVLIKI